MRTAAHRLLRQACSASFRDSLASVASLPGPFNNSAAFLGPLLALQHRSLAADAIAAAHSAPVASQTNEDVEQEATANFRLPPDESPELNQMVADFSIRLFATSVDDEAAQQGDPTAAAEPAADGDAAGGSERGAAGGEAAQPSSGAPSGAPSGTARAQGSAAARKGAARLKALEGRRPDYSVWLEAHGDAAAALREAAEKLGVNPDPLLVHIYASRATHLLECELGDV